MRYVRERPIWGPLNLSAFGLVALITIFCATVPDQSLDRWTRSYSTFCVPVPFDSPKEEINRCAFLPTAVLFERGVDIRTGKTKNKLARNLVLVERDFTKAHVDGQFVATFPLFLHYRDLRYAVFDRSNLSEVDFTGANLKGASFKGAILKDAIFKDADLSGADLRDADISGAFMEGAKLQGVRLRHRD